MPDARPLHLLLIEDSPSDAAAIREALAPLTAGGMTITHVERLAGGLERLADTAIQAVLLDLNLPDSRGLETLATLHARRPDVPVIVLVEQADEALAQPALGAGAHDYFVKGEIHGPTLAHTLRLAVERHGLYRDLFTNARRLEGRERRFRAMIENSSDVIIRVDGTGRILEAGPSTTRILGYGEDELAGVSALALVHPDDEAAARDCLETLLENPGRSALREYRLRHRDGSWRWLEVASANLLDEPDVEAVVLNMRDVTARKQAEAELAAKNEELFAMTQQLWQAGKLATLGELATGIAHELNNPLAVVSLRVEALLAQLGPDDARRNGLLVARQEIERMARLVAGLLAYGRRSSLQISTLNVRDEIENTLELIRSHLAAQRIEVSLDFAPDLPPIQADRQQLRQVLLNLLTNAADAMPQGGRLTIRAGPLEEDVLIELADTGVGITPEALPRIFEPFFTTKPEGKGTGLGLAICRRIVEEHGGALEIASAGLPGQGATVRVRLPRQRGSPPAPGG